MSIPSFTRFEIIIFLVVYICCVLVSSFRTSNIFIEMASQYYNDDMTTTEQNDFGGYYIEGPIHYPAPTVLPVGRPIRGRLQTNQPVQSEIGGLPLVENMAKAHFKDRTAPRLFGPRWEDRFWNPEAARYAEYQPSDQGQNPSRQASPLPPPTPLSMYLPVPQQTVQQTVWMPQTYGWQGQAAQPHGQLGTEAYGNYDYGSFTPAGAWA